MTYKILANLGHDKTEFNRIHADNSLYGGSTVASICGLGFESPMNVWLKRTGKKTHDPENAMMRYGSFIEQFINEEFERVINEPVRSVNQIWQSEKWKYAIATPDSIIVRPEIDDCEPVEIKSGRYFSGKAWEDGGASDSAACQLQWYLMVGGFKAGYCVGMFGGDAENIYHVRFESKPDVQAQLRERVEAFAELVQKDIPPEAGPGDAALIREYLVADVDKEQQIDLSDTHSELAETYWKLDEQFKEKKSAADEIEKELKRIKNQIIIDSDGAGKVFINGHKFSITKVEKAPYMTKPSSYHLVRFTKKKENK